MRTLLWFRTYTPRLVLAILILSALLFAFQDGTSLCNNFFKTKEADKCQKCRRASQCRHADDNGPDPKCKNHCHESMCKCISPCDT